MLCACVGRDADIPGQLASVSSPIPSCGFQDPAQVDQGQWQVVSPAESSHWPAFFFLDIYYLCI